MAVRTAIKMGLAWVLVATLASLATGCKKEDTTAADDDDEATFAEDATDANSAESDAQLLTSSLVASSPTGTIALASVDLSGSDLRPRDLGDGASAIYLPRGCLKVTHEAANQRATYNFGASAAGVCSFGPNGLTSIKGEVKANYRTTVDRLHLDLTATDLSVNTAIVDWTAAADITPTGAGTGRRMVWTAQLSGTTAGGREFARTSSLTVTWTPGEACFEMSGFSEGRIGKRQIRTEISNFRRCRRGCPDAGGKITVTNLGSGRHVELSYDGTNRATFTKPGGKEITIRLLCRV